MIHSGIPTPEINKTPIIPLENDSYSRKKSPTDLYSIFLRTETRMMRIEFIFRVTIKRKVLISLLYWS